MTQQINSSQFTQLTLGISGFEYKDLYDAKRLNDLMAVFDQSVQQHNPALFEEIVSYVDCLRSRRV